ncbi:MAG: hypothetical protein RMI94_10085 [Bryobacterales bacterium]|nr:hypothetical protein [Bryobacterales bacterium]
MTAWSNCNRNGAIDAGLDLESAPRPAGLCDRAVKAGAIGPGPA